MKLTTLVSGGFLIVSLWLVPAHSLEATGALSLYLASQRERLEHVHFPVSCNDAAQVQFDRAIALLHSFQFAPALQAFTAVTKLDPTCAMGHWGVAMSLLGDPFAWPPSARALADSWAAVGMARAAGARTQREQAYIAAIEAFCKDAETVDYRTRTLAYARTMAQLARQFPADPEATIFYALALNASALPSDKTCANQVKAATLLEQVFAVYPKHPGAAYYLAYIYEHRSFAPRGSTPHGQRPEHFWRIRNPGARWEDDWQASATERLRHFSAFCSALRSDYSQ